ncbi:TULIP family P47-like protein [Bacillus sp. SCS-151]|uniref:TULIP family P47-like protein n=1 Tax=Nanhaiella sioensis TaxID=3115293 RepID=UPI00397AEA0D
MSTTLFGWDTAYAINFDQVNEILRKQDENDGIQPHDFSGKYTSGTITGTLEDGVFDTWKISTLSDGQNLVLECPISSGIFTINDGNQELSVELKDNKNIYLEVNLDFLDEAEQQEIQATIEDQIQQQVEEQLNAVWEVTDYTPYYLAVSGNTENPARVVQHDFDLSELSNVYSEAIVEAIFSKLFSDWFIEHISEFNAVFNIFVINNEVNEYLGDEEDDINTFQWLRPTDIHYGISSTGSPTTSTLGVMAMTSNKPRPNDAHNIDYRLLDGLTRSQSTFAIDAKLVMKEIFMKGAEVTFPPGNEEKLELSPDGLTIKNNAEIEWTQFINDNGEEIIGIVPPNGYNLTMFEDKLTVTFTDITWVENKMKYMLNFSESYKVVLSNNRLRLETVGETTHNLTVDTSSSNSDDQLASFKADFAAAVIGVVSGEVFNIIAEPLDIFLTTGFFKCTGLNPEDFINDKNYLGSILAGMDKLEPVDPEVAAQMRIPMRTESGLRKASAALIEAGSEEEIEVGFGQAAQDRAAVIAIVSEGQYLTVSQKYVAGLSRINGTFWQQIRQRLPLNLKYYGGRVTDLIFSNKFGLLGGSLVGVYVKDPLKDKIKGPEPEMLNEDEVFDSIEPLQDFKDLAIGNVTWPGQEFTLDSIELNGNLLLQGTLKPESDNVV